MSKETALSYPRRRRPVLVTAGPTLIRWAGRVRRSFVHVEDVGLASDVFSGDPAKTPLRKRPDVGHRATSVSQ